jgi:NAD(P)-dependent dehydrogenase (short-subunit alcohol dehydrogenase family)
MVNPMDLSEKKILVTGASSGIGAETSVLLSQLGAKVIMIARNEERLQQTLNGLEGEGHCYYCYDLSNIDGIEELIKEIINDNGSLDGFVHSAGISSLRPLTMTKIDYFSDVLKINIQAFVELCRCLLKSRMMNDGASIIGISSVSAIQGEKGKTAYSASKAALEAVVRCMAKEYASRDIRINTVRLARIDTPMNIMLNQASSNENTEQMLLNKQYLGIGKPKDAANMIAYLLSDAATFITGSPFL